MDRPQRELRRQLDWLMTFRVVIITTLLACTFVIELLYRPLLSLKPFYMLAAVTYLLTIGYAVLTRTARPGAQVVVQMVGDLAVVTGFVYLTGGTESPFSFLYLLSIIIGSILPARYGGFAVAIGSWAMYAVMVILMHRGTLPSYPEEVFRDRDVATVRVLYSLVAHLVSFLAVAYLSSSLADNLRRAGHELQLRRDDLADLREYHANIIDSLNTGLVTTDAEGRLTFANRAALEITGRTLADLLGRDFEAVLRQERGLIGRIRAALEKDSRCRFEIDYEDGRGRSLFLGFTVSPLLSRAGEALGLIFIFQDLTEIRALEEEVALKKRMAALGEMAAGVAHELRNPLASISGSVQVLKRDLDPPGDAGTLMDIVVKESRRLDQIIRDFLMFAKPGRFHAETTDLVGLLRETLSLLENSEERRPHHRVEVAPGPDRLVADVDINRMKQVFWNLARNALKAMPGGGTLSVRLRGAEGEAVVSFVDTGIGMPDRDVASNFQPFHGSFPQGTGLGLSIVYRIIEEHGGRIRVKSRPGEGTEISLHLPRRAGGIVEEAVWTAS